MCGSEILLRVPYAEIPGEMFRDKRHYLGQLDCDKLADFVVKTRGFCVEFKAGDEELTLIPSGFMILTASRGATCLRWGVCSDDQDTARVQSMCEAVADSFAEYRNASQPLGQLLSCLKDRE